MPRRVIDRRAFLGTSAGAFICTIGGREIAVRSPQDATKADAAARAVARPAQSEPAGPFPAPQPAPGGTLREYWVQARSLRWDPIPTGRDDWHDVPVRGKRSFRAFTYRLMTAGFARPAAPASMPGPVLMAEVGDLLVVHFRNADEELGQPVTMHPHGVRYTPDYDGTYAGAYTRPGGFVEPGEEFTYLWEATPDSVGVWPYHDHGPNHMLNTFRGLFGAIVVRERGAKAPDVGQDVALHVMGMDDAWHDFHVHGHRWRDPGGAFVDTPSVGPNEVITARFTEDNPGRWLYHCHVFSHQDGGMAGWYVVDA